MPKENFIIEPSGKNTAPAIGLAALHVFKRDSNAVMGVYSADHLIEGNNEFKTAIQDAKAMVKKKSCLVTIGINPTYPSTGYGYIQCDMNKKVDINKLNPALILSTLIKYKPVSYTHLTLPTNREV